MIKNKFFKYSRTAFLTAALCGLFLAASLNNEFKGNDVAAALAAKDEIVNLTEQVSQTEQAASLQEQPDVTRQNPEPQSTSQTSVKQEAPTQQQAPAANGAMSINIPSISLAAPIITVGLEKNGELHVPGNTTQAGWYKHSPIPGDVSSGQIGSSIITAHLDFGANFTPGVFYNLNKVKIGQEIRITRPDGYVAVFEVTSAQVFLQKAFPTQLVYGPVSGAQLKLITCAGKYDPAAGRNTHNLVVFAKLINII